MSSSSVLRPEILVIGNRSYRINPSSLPSLEPIDNQQYQVYREEDEADYYVDNRPDDDDDEPSCKPQQKRTTTGAEAKPQNGSNKRLIYDNQIQKDRLTMILPTKRYIYLISLLKTKIL